MRKPHTTQARVRKKFRLRQINHQRLKKYARQSSKNRFLITELEQYMKWLSRVDLFVYAELQEQTR